MTSMNARQMAFPMPVAAGILMPVAAAGLRAAHEQLLRPAPPFPAAPFCFSLPPSAPTSPDHPFAVRGASDVGMTPADEVAAAANLAAQKASRRAAAPAPPPPETPATDLDDDSSY